MLRVNFMNVICRKARFPTPPLAGDRAAACALTRENARNPIGRGATQTATGPRPLRPIHGRASVPLGFSGTRPNSE